MREIVNKRLMITSSLLDSLDFHVGMSSHSDWKLKSLESLRKTLSRTGDFEETAATHRGKEFEDQLCSFSRIPRDKFLQVMQKFCICDVEKLGPFYDAVTGGQFQKVVKGDLDIDGQKVFLYGKEDVFHPGKILDIKTTASAWIADGRYPSDAKYRSRNQHTMYMCLDGVHNFDYLIAEFTNTGTADKPEWMVLDTHTVSIEIKDLNAEMDRLKKKISDALDFFAQDQEMWYNLCNVYTKSW